MPWKSGDASRFTKKAKSPAAKKQFAKVANKILADTGDEGRAVRIASGAVKKRRKK